MNKYIIQLVLLILFTSSCGSQPTRNNIEGDTNVQSNDTEPSIQVIEPVRPSSREGNSF